MAAQAQTLPGFGGYLVGYMSTADGPADLLDLVQVGASWIKQLPLSKENLACAESVRAHASNGWAVLVFPDILVEGTKFFHTLVKTEAVSSTVFLQGVDFLNALSEGAFLMHNKKWVNLGACGSWAGGICGVTALIADGVDISEQLNTLDNPLSLIKLVKDIVSVALTLIGLVVLACETAVFPLAVLCLSTVYISAKITISFYERAYPA